MILTPVFILVGGAISILLRVQLAHDGFTVWLDGVMTVAFVLGTLILGYVLLALVD